MWTTRDELEYLASLGTHSESAIVTALSKAEMLRNYIAAAHQRSEWGLIDPAVVIARAEDLLRRCIG